MAYKNSWGKEQNEGLKYKYENENDKYNSKVIEKQMTKEELEGYLKGLEVKNKWKTRKVF